MCMNSHMFISSISSYLVSLNLLCIDHSYGQSRINIHVISVPKRKEKEILVDLSIIHLPNSPSNFKTLKTQENKA